eukprot:9378991-Alexandrium_andersonii.AAC.1
MVGDLLRCGFERRGLHGPQALRQLSVPPCRALHVIAIGLEVLGALARRSGGRSAHRSVAGLARGFRPEP